MHTITEAEAQQLANLMKCWVYQDEFMTQLSKEKPIYRTLYGQHIRYGWMCVDGGCSNLVSTCRIASDRPWTEQIWGPEPSTPPTPSENV